MSIFIEELIIVFNEKKGQGTIEYIVIIAIVIVIGLIVATLVFGMTGQFGTVSETASKATWRTAEPWAVVDWGRSTDGVITIVLKNNTGETLNFTDIKLTSTASDQNTQTQNSVAPAGTVTRRIATATSSCPSGTKYSYVKDNIIIDYNNAYIAGRTQQGAAGITGTC
ncbi:MAG: class III signal peptide-containing protein [Candidatus Diapherotrites archaeon]|nr:class III signal peptide-containing protein [Candidatus Diapherotrites archaeon]